LRRHAGKVPSTSAEAQDDELKVVLQTVWKELPQEDIDNAVTNFTKRLTACVAANGDHFDYLQLYQSHKSEPSSQHQKPVLEPPTYYQENTTFETLKTSN